MSIGGDILGYYYSNSPNIHRKIYWITPTTYILGIYYWKTSRDALNSQCADDRFDLFLLLLISHIG